MTLTQILQIVSILLTGLLAGLFYGYDCSVTLGLSHLPDEAYLQAFKSINRAILRPYFFLTFMGSALVLPVTAWMIYRTGTSTNFYFMAAAASSYIVGVLLLTLLCNVPLNEMLDKVDVDALSQIDLRTTRHKFEASWNLWHQIRTYVAMLAFLLSILSVIKYE